jgi:2-iminoacetate synthase ThiH
MAELQRLIRDAGRIPVQRDSLYNELERFDAPAVA